MVNYMGFMSGLFQNRQESQWLILVIIFIAMFVLVLAFMALFNDAFDPVRTRLKNIVVDDELLPLASDHLSDQLRKHQLLYIPVNQSLLQRTATRLHYAGYHLRDSLLHYYSLKMLATVLLPILVLIVMFIIRGVRTEALVYSVITSVVVGYLAPSFILDKLIATRQKTLKRSFPDALDMIVICSEAGLSLDAALQKVSEDRSKQYLPRYRSWPWPDLQYSPGDQVSAWIYCL